MFKEDLYNTLIVCGEVGETAGSKIPTLQHPQTVRVCINFKDEYNCYHVM